jgi:hypothetical protein
MKERNNKLSLVFEKVTKLEMAITHLHTILENKLEK